MRIFAGLVSTAILGLTACVSPQDAAPAAALDPTPDPYADMVVDVHDGEFATIQQFTTPGGVSVWLVDEPSIPILSLQMAWPEGTASDPEGQEGLTNAFAYHMNEGAGELDSQAFFKRMEELNMSFGCGADNDNTYCTASMLTENAPASFALIGLAYAEPRFDEGPFERFIREQQVSLETRETDAGYLAGRAMEQALYPDHPYARETSAESIAALSIEAMRMQKNQIMVRNGMLVTAVGAISADDLARLIDTAVVGLPETAGISPVAPVTLASPQSEPIIIDLPQPQSLVRFTGPAMRQDDPDYYTGVVLNYTFGGGGFESRLMKELRVARGLTYGIRTGITAEDKIQTWSGSGQTKNESAGEFIEAIKDEMTQIVDTGITPEELSDAKAYLIGSYPLGFDSNSKIAGNMMEVRLDGLPVDFFDKRNAMVEAVTLDDVNRVASEYLSPENFTFVVVGEPQGMSTEVNAELADVVGN